MTPAPKLASQVGAIVERAVFAAPARDIHTHLYAPACGARLRWGIDELLTFHSLVAEGFRHWEMPYEAFWTLDQPTQAELIWTTLFVQRSPVSEACRHVLTALHALGVDLRGRDLASVRRWYASHQVDGLLLRVMDLAGVRTICMAVSPLKAEEQKLWERGVTADRRFTRALRVDDLLHQWPTAAHVLDAAGYHTDGALNAATYAAVRQFLADWTVRTDPLYLFAAMPPGFDYPGDSVAARLLDNVLLPHCAETNRPLALIPGVRRAVNPGTARRGRRRGTRVIGSLRAADRQPPAGEIPAHRAGAREPA